MEKEKRKKISELSHKIDELEIVLDLLSTADTLLFTTEERKLDECVTLSLSEETEKIINQAKAQTKEYIENKIAKISEQIDAL